MPVQGVRRVGSLQHVSLGLLIVLSTLLDRRRIAHTTRHLRLDRPTIDRTLTQLHSRLNSPLLIHTNTDLIPAPQTLRLVIPLTRTLTRIRSLLSPGAFSPTVTGHAFHLTVSSCNTTVILPALVHALHHRTPNVSLRVDRTDHRNVLSTILGNSVSTTLKIFPRLPGRLHDTPLFRRRCTYLVSHGDLPTSNALSLPACLTQPRILLRVHNDNAPRVRHTLATLHRHHHITVDLPR